MSLTLKLAHPTLLGELEITAKDEIELIERTHFWWSLPTDCPIDGTAVRLTHKRVTAKSGENAGSTFDYYSLVSSGDTIYESKLGQRKDGSGLFYTAEWEKAYHQPDAPAARPTGIGEARARGMVEALRKLGQEDAFAFAEEVLGREVRVLAVLTDEEAVTIYNAAKSDA